MSLRVRLALLTSAVLAVVLLLGGVALERLFAAALLREVDVSLQSVGELLAQNVARSDPLRPMRVEELWLELYGVRVVDKVVQLLDRDGRVDLQSEGLGTQIPVTDAAREAAKNGQAWLETLTVGRIPVRVLTVPVYRRGYLRHVVQIGSPLGEVEASLRALRVVLLGAFPVALVLVASGAWWLAGRVLRPVDEVTRAARSLSARSLDRRLPPLQVKDEIGRLVDTLNEMIERLESSFEMARRFSADASHELRTPLTVLRGELELALRAPRSAEQYREVLASGLEEVGKLSQIVDDLLFLSRNERAVRPSTPVDLNEVATEVVASLLPLARERTLYLRLSLDPSGAVVVEGDAGQLGRMLRNLVENGIYYTPGGGIGVSVRSDGETALLRVEDTGVGIAPEHHGRVFSRFYRADLARSRAPGSSGLGLSIVKQVAEAHGGSVELQSAPGAGSTFTVRLPVAAGRSSAA
jgi:two-component system, OmpR family, sensor kinase